MFGWRRLQSQCGSAAPRDDQERRRNDDDDDGAEKEEEARKRNGSGPESHSHRRRRLHHHRLVFAIVGTRTIPRRALLKLYTNTHKRILLSVCLVRELEMGGGERRRE